MVKNKKLEKTCHKEYVREHNFFIKCQNMFMRVNGDLEELDRLHAVVLEAAAKIGKDAECGREDGKCFSCKRNEAQAARMAAAEKAAVEKAEAKKEIGEKKGRIKGKMGKAARGKQILEAILEEDESQDAANA